MKSLTNKVYPDPLASADEKASPEYGLKMGKLIEDQWFRRPIDGGHSPFYGRREEFHKLRLYARGEQSSDLYKNLLTGGKDSTYSNFDWRPLQIVPKFVKLITNQMFERLYEVKLEAVDKYSTDLKDKRRKYLEQVVASKPIYELAQQQLGVDITPENYQELPQSNEEVDLYMTLEYKPAIEIAAETALRYTLDLNGFEEIQQRVLEDITTVGISAMKHYTDRHKGIVVEWVDVANMVYGYARNRDFSDVTYYGEVKRISVHELQRISGTTFTKEEIKMLAKTSRQWDLENGITQNVKEHELGDTMLNILFFTFETFETNVYKKKKRANKTFTITKKDKGFESKTPTTDGYEVLTEGYNVWYEGILVLGTDKIFNYKKCTNMVRPKGHIKKALPSYVMYAPDLYQNRVKSLVSRIIPYVDQMQQIHIKIQQLIAKARPNGIYIDIDGLNEVPLGDGNFLTPLEVIRIYDETGNVLGTSLTSEGEYNYGKEPIRELKNGVVDGIDRLITAYNHYLNLLRDAIGVPQGADASMPHPDTLVGVQEQVALNSNTATRHIADATIKMTQRLCEGLTLRLQDIFVYSNLKEVYLNAIGKFGYETLRSMKDFSIHDFGITVEMKPDAQERRDLEANIQVALSRDLITLADAIDIRAIKNLKLANKVIEIRSNKREEQKNKAAKEQIQANAEAQMQSAQVAAQAKLQEIQAEAEMKLRLTQAEVEGKKMLLETEAMLKEKLMGLEFNYNMSLKGVEVESKTKLEAFKESAKDARTEKQATQQSKLKEQAQFNKPAINFESSEDNLTGGLGIDQLNPT